MDVDPRCVGTGPLERLDPSSSVSQPSGILTALLDKHGEKLVRSAWSWGSSQLFVEIYENVVPKFLRSKVARIKTVPVGSKSGKAFHNEVPMPRFPGSQRIPAERRRNYQEFWMKSP